MTTHRAKKGMIIVPADNAECIVVSWALITFVGYHTPLSFLITSVLTAVVAAEIIFMSGGLRGQEREIVEPYVES